MNVKGGTQTWSKAEQLSSLKSDPSKTLSATNMQEALGSEQSVGDILNKVADPNFVETKKVRRPGNSNLDKDAFLKLMLTQMKYQDPTNPMQNHEMAAQLAQFTTLEQLNNINGTLESMKNQAQPTTNYQALNFIGKKVSGDSSKLVRSAGDKMHDFNFELMNDAKEVTVEVKDAEGTTIRKLSAKNLKKGQNNIPWNGLTEDGEAARPGEYKFVVEGKSTAGTKVLAKTTFDGKITGLNFAKDGPILMVGTQTVRMSDVKKIYEPSPEETMMEQMQMMPGMPMTPLKAGEAATLPAASDDAPKSTLEKNIGMSRGLMNDLAKVNEKKS